MYNKSSCDTCTAGNFCPSLGDGSQICPPGTFQPEAKKTFCNECPAGFYCPTASI